MREAAEFAARLILTDNWTMTNAIDCANEEFDLYLTDDQWCEFEEMIEDNLNVM